MKTEHPILTPHKGRGSSLLYMAAVTVLFGAQTGFAQTVDYLYTGSNVVVTLNPGTYDITAYGAQGGSDNGGAGDKLGGLGAEMSAEFNFPTATNLTLLVGGAGTSNSGEGAGGGGGSFIACGFLITYFGESDQPFVIAGGGGGGGLGTPGLNGGTGTSGSNGTGPFGNGGGGGSNGGGGGGGSGYDYTGGGGGGGFTGSGGNGFQSDPPIIPNDGGAGGSSYGGGGAGGAVYGSGGGGTGGFGGGGGGGFSGGGGGGGYSGGGGGEGGNDPGGGGSGGSYIDSAAVAVLTGVSGVASPDDSPNGEIIITAVDVQSQSAPPLSISHSGKTVTVSWQNVFGWNLQQNANPASPAGWTSTGGIITNNGTNYLNITAPTGNLFFRLQGP